MTAREVFIYTPLILDFQNIALWFSVAAGAGLIAYSLITDYVYSIAKVLPFNVHIIFDLLPTVASIIAPFVLGFTGVVQIYYIVMDLVLLPQSHLLVKLRARFKEQRGTGQGFVDKA